MTLNKYGIDANLETKTSFLDRCYCLTPKKKDAIRGLRGDVLIFPLPHHKRRFEEQEWYEKLSWEEFQAKLNSLPDT